MDGPGKFATDPVAIRKVSFQEQAFAASNANAEIRLPAGNLIRSAFVRTEGGTTAGEPSLQVNNLQLLNGVDVRVNLSGAMLRAKNNADFGQLTTGYYVGDVLARSASAVNLSELWDVSTAAEPKCVLDITGGATVKAQVVTTEYIPLAQL